MGSRTVVLIVDDSETDRLRLKHVVRRVAPEAKIHEAANAGSALERLATTTVDVLITDQHMAGASGVDLLEAAFQRHAATRRIMITSDTDLALLQQALARGRVQGYLLKEWKLERLQSALREILQPSAIG